MTNLRGNAALHCVVTTYKGRAPEVRYYIAVYTEDLDHYHEIPLAPQQWRLALTTALPIVYFDKTGDSHGESETKLSVEGDANSQIGSRHVRAADARLRQQYEETRVVDRRSR